MVQIDWGIPKDSKPKFRIWFTVQGAINQTQRRRFAFFRYSLQPMLRRVDRNDVRGFRPQGEVGGSF